MDWFNSSYSDSDLAEILSDYHKAVTGYRLRLQGQGRCTLVRELEQLDRVRGDLYDDHCVPLAEPYTPYNTVNS
jgi:hypothetical protein